MVLLNPNCSEVIYLLQDSIPILGHLYSASINIFEAEEIIRDLEEIFGKLRIKRVYITSEPGNPDIVATLISIAYLRSIGELEKIPTDELAENEWVIYEYIERAKELGLEIYLVDPDYVVARTLRKGEGIRIREL